MSKSSQLDFSKFSKNDIANFEWAFNPDTIPSRNNIDESTTIQKIQALQALLIRKRYFYTSSDSMLNEAVIENNSLIKNILKQDLLLPSFGWEKLKIEEKEILSLRQSLTSTWSVENRSIILSNKKKWTFEKENPLASKILNLFKVLFQKNSSQKITEENFLSNLTEKLELPQLIKNFSKLPSASLKKELEKEDWTKNVNLKIIDMEAQAGRILKEAIAKFLLE